MPHTITELMSERQTTPNRIEFVYIVHPGNDVQHG